VSAARDLHARIIRRVRRAGQSPTEAQIDALALYLTLLGRWNARINLTSLKVDHPNDDAVDRLIVEPVVAAAHVGFEPATALDVGSGGGSPALPLKIMRSGLRYVLVESKVRKSAFLREVIRELGLTDVEVENRRFEELLSRVDLHESIDLITMRAVRLDRRLRSTMLAFLADQGRVFLFGTQASDGTKTEQVAPLVVRSTVQLPARPTGQLLILARRVNGS
jgi:16S rRNA (guanine527-N7)-methyltransferase